MPIASTSRKPNSDQTVLAVHYTNEWPFVLRPIEIKNEWTKPSGGLWTSPFFSLYGWRVWCGDEGYYMNPHRVLMELSLERNLRIDGYADLDKITWTKRGDGFFYNVCPDFEAMAEKYDTIWLTKKGERETRLIGGTRLDTALYGAGLTGWDCETILVMHERAVRALRCEKISLTY